MGSTGITSKASASNNITAFLKPIDKELIVSFRIKTNF
jgi:hypothetical protein